MKCKWNDGEITAEDGGRIVFLGVTYLGNAYALRDAYGLGCDAYGILRDDEWHENSIAALLRSQ